MSSISWRKKKLLVGREVLSSFDRMEFCRKAVGA